MNLRTKTNATTFPVTGLQAYTDYSFMVQAANNKGNGPLSISVTNRTFEAGKLDLCLTIVAVTLDIHTYCTIITTIIVLYGQSLFSAECTFEMVMWAVVC